MTEAFGAGLATSMSVEHPPLVRAFTTVPTRAQQRRRPRTRERDDAFGDDGIAGADFDESVDASVSAGPRTSGDESETLPHFNRRQRSQSFGAVAMSVQEAGTLNTEALPLDDRGSNSSATGTAPNVPESPLQAKRMRSRSDTEHSEDALAADGSERQATCTVVVQTPDDHHLRRGGQSLSPGPSAFLSVQTNGSDTTATNSKRASVATAEGSQSPSLLPVETGKTEKKTPESITPNGSARKRFLSVLGKVRTAVKLQQNAVETTSDRRIRVLLQQISAFETGGKLEGNAAIRLLQASGFTICSELQQKIINATSKDELREIILSTPSAVEEIGKMDHLDSINEVGDNKATVALSRVVISSRIEAISQRAKTAAGSWVHQAFELLHLFSILFYFWVSTYFGVIALDREPYSVFICMCICQLIWLLDIIWNLLIPVTAGGKMINEFRSVVAVRWPVLLLDFCCMLPIDVILFPFCEAKSAGDYWPFKDNYKVLSAFLVVRFMKLIKPVRILFLFEFANLDIITPAFVTFFFLIKPTLRIFAFSAVAVQCIVALFIHVEKPSAEEPPVISYLDGTVYVFSMITGAGINVSFTGSGGYVVEFMLLCLGLTAQAAVISNLSVTVFRQDVNSKNLAQMRETLSILEHFKVPEDVGTEILSFQLHALSDDVSSRLSMLDTLPLKMQKEVMLYVKIAAVNTVRLFSKATHECKTKIAESLVQTVVPPTTDIVSIGDIGEEMFLIAHGYATVIIFNGATVAMLSRGDYFGEVALLLPNNVRQATVRALTYCDLWVLDKKAFLEILHEFPSLLDAMEDDLKLKGINVRELGLLKTTATTASPQPPAGSELKVSGEGPQPTLAMGNPSFSLPLLRRHSVSRNVPSVNNSTNADGGFRAAAATNSGPEGVLDPNGEIAFDVPHTQTAFTGIRGVHPAASVFEMSMNHFNNNRSTRRSMNRRSSASRRLSAYPTAPFRSHQPSAPLFISSAAEGELAQASFRSSEGSLAPSGPQDSATRSRPQSPAVGVLPNPFAPNLRSPETLLATRDLFASPHTVDATRIGIHTPQELASFGHIPLSASLRHLSVAPSNWVPQLQDEQQQQIAELRQRVHFLENELFTMTRDVQELVAVSGSPSS